MNFKTPLVRQLSTLSSLKENSKNLFSVSEKVLTLAFFEPKPLFTDSDNKDCAATLLEKSVPLLIEAFAILYGSLNIDKREFAQCCRSGLQYLIDEFRDSGVYPKLEPILTSGSVKNVEEYIENSKDIEPEYPDYTFTVDEKVEMPLFDVFTKEWLSSWDEPDVIEWKKRAKKLLKSYYLGFAGSQWDNYGVDYDKKDLLAKICFAMFGSPTKESDELCDCYTDEQKSSASSIMEKILEVYRSVPSKDLLVGTIFISCKKDENEFPLPLFSVFSNGDPTSPRASRLYVDTQKRIYKDWDDWKNNNTLPMLKYAFPRRGFFTSSNECKYVFDPDGEPDIAFGTSPQCDFTSRLFRQTDSLSALVSLGCGTIAVISMFTPLAPAVVLASAIGGGSSAVYGTARAVNRLIDKGQHSENLADLESFMLYFSIAATPLNFTSSLVNASLVKGATVNGRIFSDSTRMFATIINFSTLGVDTVLVGFGLANMIEKAKNDQLTALDVVQFSMSLFFFTNTLIRPQMASKIIKNAQEHHIQQYANSMSDEAARSTFNKFVNDNKGTGSIKDTSKIVRTINRIKNPESVFGGLKSADKVMIGGRKGKTLLVTDNYERTNRVKPNNVIFTNPTVKNFKPVILKVKRLNNEDITNIEVNGKKFFKNLNNKQKARVNRVFLDAAGNKEDVLNLALKMAKCLGCTELEQFLSVVEIAGAHVIEKKVVKTELINKLGGIKEFNDFIYNIEKDMKYANKLANKEGLQFRDPYKAVYHYRKHGSEFSSKIKYQTIEFYLEKVPDKLINDYNLVETTYSPDADGYNTKIYNTIDDKFAVVVENVDTRIISTMYKADKSYAKFISRLTKTQEGYTRPNPLEPLPKFINEWMGFRGFSIHLILANGVKIEME